MGANVFTVCFRGISGCTISLQHRDFMKTNNISKNMNKTLTFCHAYYPEFDLASQLLPAVPAPIDRDKSPCIDGARGTIFEPLADSENTFYDVLSWSCLNHLAIFGDDTVFS